MNRNTPDPQQVFAELARIEAVEESPDGLVEATIGSRGQLRALWIDPRAYREQDADRLTESIMDAVGAGTELVDRRAFEVSASLLPPGTRPEEADLAFGPVLYGIEKLQWERITP
jgi:DNA-binding protein YbaB